METALKTPYRTFADALIQVIDQKLTTFDECAEVAEVSGQTIRNIYHDRSQVGIEKAKRLANLHPNPEVRQILGDALLSGGDRMATPVAGETDLDGDGVTTEKDAVMALAQVVKEASAELDDLIAETGHRLTPVQVQRAIGGAHDLRRKIELFIGTVERSTRQQFSARRAG